MSFLFSKPDPAEATKRWKRELQKESRMLEREIRGIEMEERKVKMAIKQAAKKGEIQSAKILAKELVNSKRTKERLHKSKAHLHSVQMTLQSNLDSIPILSIYASPPIGLLRWKPPIKAKRWNGTRKATAYGSVCPQKELLPTLKASGPTALLGDEDCLYLNIYAPLTANPSSNLPVLVFIHGGSFIFGAGSNSYYNGSILANTTNTITVTLNYRLGLLGFLPLPAFEEESGVTGNYALQDIMFALSWVRSNIEGFGGNSESITVFGQSAGSKAINLLLLISLTEGLFDKAIMESGATGHKLQDKVGMESINQMILSDLKCNPLNSSTVLECMRSVSVSSIMQIQNDLDDNGIWRAGPTVDGKLIVAQPRELEKAGKIHKVPIMTGATMNESTVLLWLDGLRPESLTREKALQWLAKTYGPSAVDSILKLYNPDSFPSTYAFLGKVSSDSEYICQNIRFAKTVAETRSNHSNVYFYEFTYTPSFIPLNFVFGAYHTAELSFVFGHPCFLSCLHSIPPSFDPGFEQKFSEKMMGYWSNFATTGDPNDLLWPEYSPTENWPSIVLNAQQDDKVKFNSYSAQCDFWYSLYDKE